VDDLEGVLDDSDGHDLLAVVSAVHHEGVDESLDDGALGLSESFNLVSATSVWKVLGVSVGAGQVILEGDVVDLEPECQKTPRAPRFGESLRRVGDLVKQLGSGPTIRRCPHKTYRNVVGGPSSEELDGSDFGVADVFLSPISFAFHGYILRSEFC